MVSFCQENNDTIRLISLLEQKDFKRGDEITIRWKMDSIRSAGASKILYCREFLIDIKKIKSKFLDKNFKDSENESFVISCGTGCAMAHQVKKITRINSTTVNVVFEVDQYIDEELVESFENTFIFRNNKDKTIEIFSLEGKNVNIKNIFLGGALQTFQDFGQKLMH